MKRKQKVREAWMRIYVDVRLREDMGWTLEQIEGRFAGV